MKCRIGILNGHCSYMQTNDIVIPLNACGSYHDNLELRYTLRSISESLINYRKIIIVCDRPPGWLRNVQVVKHAELHHKAVTLANKWLAGANYSNADNIVLWSDDQVLLKPINVLGIPILRDGLKQMSDYNMDIPWHEILRNTAKVLKLHGKTAFNCECHTPRLLNRKKFTALLDLFKEEINYGRGIVASSLYFNYFSYPMQDMNLYKASFESKTAVLDMTNGIIGDKIFLGYNDYGFESGINEYLKSRFSHKSKYEV